MSEDILKIEDIPQDIVEFTSALFKVEPEAYEGFDPEYGQDDVYFVLKVKSKFTPNACLEAESHWCKYMNMHHPNLHNLRLLLFPGA